MCKRLRLITRKVDNNVTMLILFYSDSHLGIKLKVIIYISLLMLYTYVWLFTTSFILHTHDYTK